MDLKIVVRDLSEQWNSLESEYANDVFGSLYVLVL